MPENEQNRTTVKLNALNHRMDNIDEAWCKTAGVVTSIRIRAARSSPTIPKLALCVASHTAGAGANLIL